MKKIILIACLLLMFCCVMPASAVIIDDNIIYMQRGNGYLQSENVNNEYFVVISAGSPNNIVLYDNFGQGSTIAYGNNSYNNPKSCYVASDGYLYFSSSNGVFRKTDRDTSPQDLGKSSSYVQISTHARVSAWDEDQNYIYYYDQASKSVFRIDKSTYLTSTVGSYGVLQQHVADMSVVDPDNIYFITYVDGGVSDNPRVHRNNNAYYFQLLNNRDGLNHLYGGIHAINSTHIYYMVSSGYGSTFVNQQLRIISDSGTAFSQKQSLSVTNNMVSDGTQTGSGYTIGYLGERTPVYYYKDGTKINMLQVADFSPYEGGTSFNLNPYISWNQSSYSLGDTATISYSLENPDYDTYSYQIRIGDSTSIQKTTTVTDIESGTESYTFSPTAMASTYLAQILATNTTSGDVTILTGATASLITTESYSISFSKDVYAHGDNMEIFYSGLPTNTQIYLRGTKSNPFEVVYTKSYYKTGSGSVILSVPSQTATDYAVYAIYQNYTLASDYCDVALSESQATLSGIVRDAQTGARIEGAHVMLDGLGPYTDDVGSYSMIRDIGTYNFTVSASGYHYYTKQLDLFNDKVWPIYLTPADFPGNLYGSVTDYSTGERLSGVQITVENATDTKTFLTGSGGFYSVEGLVNGTTYSFTAKLDGYDTYSNSSVDIDQVTWLDVKLIPEGYSQPSAGDDSTTSDRPDHDAAEEVVNDWYDNVPGIFRLATVLFVFVLLRRGTK